MRASWAFGIFWVELNLEWKFCVLVSRTREDPSNQTTPDTASREDSVFPNVAIAGAGLQPAANHSTVCAQK